VTTNGADAQSDDIGFDDIGFLRALRPIVEFLGGGLVSASDAGPGDLPIERNGRVLAHVRSNELHSALDRMIETVERDAGAELSSMNRVQKQIAVRTLDEQGVFLLRGAVDQVAKSMGVSRVTLYSYLNALERRT
jgi:HTH domain